MAAAEAAVESAQAANASNGRRRAGQVAQPAGNGFGLPLGRQVTRWLSVPKTIENIQRATSSRAPGAVRTAFYTVFETFFRDLAMVLKLTMSFHAENTFYLSYCV